MPDNLTDLPADPSRAQLDSMVAGFDAMIGLRYESVTPDGVVAGWEISDKHHQPYGITHGGVYCSVIESVASVSGAVWLGAQGSAAGVVGVNNNTDFLRAVRAGKLTARSIPVHRGRRQQLWRVEITDEANKLVAQGQVRLQNVEPDTLPQ